MERKHREIFVGGRKVGILKACSMNRAYGVQVINDFDGIGYDLRSRGDAGHV